MTQGACAGINPERSQSIAINVNQKVKAVATPEGGWDRGGEGDFRGLFNTTVYMVVTSGAHPCLLSQTDVSWLL